MPMYQRKAMGGRIDFGSDNKFFEIPAMGIIGRFKFWWTQIAI